MQKNKVTRNSRMACSLIFTEQKSRKKANDICVNTKNNTKKYIGLCWSGWGTYKYIRVTLQPMNVMASWVSKVFVKTTKLLCASRTLAAQRNNQSLALFIGLDKPKGCQNNS